MSWDEDLDDDLPPESTGDLPGEMRQGRSGSGLIGRSKSTGRRFA